MLVPPAAAAAAVAAGGRAGIKQWSETTLQVLNDAKLPLTFIKLILYKKGIGGSSKQWCYKDIQ